MTMRQFPIQTIGLVMTLIALHWLAPDKALLYFSAADIARGETWRIVTGHFVHADLEHLLWNCLGLAVLGMLIEHRSRFILWAALGAGITSVSALLLTPFSPLDYYCGLSGVLNTLLLVALWLEWQRSPLLADLSHWLRQYRQNSDRAIPGDIPRDPHKLASLCLVTCGRLDCWLDHYLLCQFNVQN